jgi:hypothetical protein
MVKQQIEIADLRTFDVAADGLRVRINMCDQQGEPLSLVVPTTCLSQLLMSLPSMLQSALRVRHEDDSLRMVHPLEHFAIELGEVSAVGEQQFILTMQTDGGYAVSFSSSEDGITGLARSIFRDVLSNPLAQDVSMRLS